MKGVAPASEPETQTVIALSMDQNFAKVLDFGLSKFLPRPSQAGTTKRQRAVTAEAQVMGTAHYMSPEQWVSAKDVGPATDIWSLGVILYEGLTGESPFMRNNLAAMCNAVLREDPPAILELRPDVPEGLVAIVDRCLAKEATLRFARTAWCRFRRKCVCRPKTYKPSSGGRSLKFSTRALEIAI